MEELRILFGDFAAKATDVVLNLDNAETAALAPGLKRVATFSLSNPAADFLAGPRSLTPSGIGFAVTARGQTAEVALQIPGEHNVANALAAIAAAAALGVSLETATAALGAFTGVKRRLDVLGNAAGVTVIDDFAHNPDKIAATLDTLHAYPGRLLIMFQPHGYGPLKLMGDAFVDCFASRMAPDDELVMTPPVYFGGTADRSVGSEEIAAAIAARGRDAVVLADRPACGARLLDLARPGDRILIMGARDDSLSVFGGDILAELGKRAG
jgi:UDP-N-acetylmuramate--alanine ligase